jgi:MATE family multidrug resistance protein
MLLYQKYKPHYKSSLQLAIPVVISQLGHTLVHTADSVIVGHFAGTIPLAAVSLVHGLFTIIMVIGMGISYGLTPLIAQQNGQNNYDNCGKLFLNSLLINFTISLILFVIIRFGMGILIDHVNQSPAVVATAKPYLSLLGVSIIPLMVFNTFKQFAEGLGFTKQAMMISIWGNALNIILGVIFVKGMFGIHPMGVMGVGWSTLIDRTLMSLLMGFYILKSRHFQVYIKNIGLKSLSWICSLQILKIGTPVALQYTFEISAFSGAAILMGTLGAIPQAAHQIAINLASTTYMMASGISSAATIKTGNNYGISDFKQLRLSAISSYHIVLVFMACTGLLFVLLNSYLPYLFTEDQAVITVAAQLIIIAGFFQLFDGAQVVGLGILRGIGDVNIPTFITFIAYWIVGLPVAYYLGISLKLGANGIWYGLTLGLLISAFFIFIRFHSFTKKMEMTLNIKA